MDVDNAAIETILKILVSAAAALTGWYAALKPLFNYFKEKKRRKQEAIEAVIKNDKEYRQAVLDKLDSLHQRIDENDVSLALLQRESIERAYCMFVIEHGYCPSGMKQSINDMYQYYTDRGYNHIAKGRVEELLSLPEFPSS